MLARWLDNYSTWADRKNILAAISLSIRIRTDYSLINTLKLVARNRFFCTKFFNYFQYLKYLFGISKVTSTIRKQCKDFIEPSRRNLLGSTCCPIKRAISVTEEKNAPYGSLNTQANVAEVTRIAFFDSNVNRTPATERSLRLNCAQLVEPITRRKV